MTYLNYIPLLVAKVQCSGGKITGLGTANLTINCQPGVNIIYSLAVWIINFMIGLILGLAVLAVIVAGIQYVTSQGSPDAIKKAKERIINVLIGLSLLGLIRVIMEFLLK